MQRSAHILAARRSPVAPRGGDLATLELHALAAPVIRAVLGDAGIGAAQVDEIIVSNALGAGGNPARLVALAADLPQRIGGYSIDRQCCGGLDALALARAMIVSGQAEIVLAGGVETYSQRPIRLRSRHGPMIGGVSRRLRFKIRIWVLRRIRLRSRWGSIARRRMLGLG